MVSQMSLDTSLADSISTFPVSPSRDQLITLTYGQLQDLITQAVAGAIQGLQDRVESLEATVAGQGEKIAALETTQEQDINRICLDIAFDRQRLAALEKVEPQPLQKDRGEILRALLVANGGKMMAKEARQKMHLSRSAFSQLIATMRDDIELKQFYLKKNQKVIALKSCLAKQ